MDKIFKNGKTLMEYWERGFLVPSLILLDEYGTKRWTWWLPYVANNQVPDTPIPQINWNEHHFKKDNIVKQLQKCVKQCNLDEFLDFILYGMGEGDSLSWVNTPHSIILSWEKILHEIFPEMMLKPYPYFSNFIEQEMGQSRRSGNAFYSTPIHMSEAMSRMTFDGIGDITKSVLDPCCGTGNLLLTASNYSINLYGQDINATVLKGCKIHGYMYVPWLVKPLDCIRIKKEVRTV